VAALPGPLPHLPIPPKKLFALSPIVRIRLGSLIHPSGWKLHFFEFRVSEVRRGTPPTTDESDRYEGPGMRDFGKMSCPFDTSEPFITPT
jgi:hypothetical protein